MTRAAANACARRASQPPSAHQDWLR